MNNGNLPQQNFAQLVRDLTGLQSEVQQFDPSLSSEWGWLAAQGKAILANDGSAQITQTEWVARYHDFLTNKMGDSTTTFAQAVQNEGASGVVDNLASSVSSLPQRASAAAVNLANTVGTAAGSAAGSAISAGSNASGITGQSLLGWGLLFAGVVFVLPAVLGSKR